MGSETLQDIKRQEMLNVSDAAQALYGGDGKRVISLKKGNKEGNVMAGMEIDNARLNG